MPTIRKKDGLSAFPSRDESPYDTFGVGHSSTSISAALGMAIAARLDHRDRHAVAIIGDGGLTGGMAFEALNHAGVLDANLLVVLNDNEMSISPNVGAMNNYLAKIAVRQVLFQRPRRQQAAAEKSHAQRVGTGPPRRGTRQGHGGARHPVRGTGLQLHRPDRRP